MAGTDGVAITLAQPQHEGGNRNPRQTGHGYCTTSGPAPRLTKTHQNEKTALESTTRITAVSSASSSGIRGRKVSNARKLIAYPTMIMTRTLGKLAEVGLESWNAHARCSR